MVEKAIEVEQSGVLVGQTTHTVPVDNSFGQKTIDEAHKGSSDRLANEFFNAYVTSSEEQKKEFLEASGVGHLARYILEYSLVKNPALKPTIEKEERMKQLTEDLLKAVCKDHANSVIQHATIPGIKNTVDDLKNKIKTNEPLAVAYTLSQALNEMKALPSPKEDASIDDFANAGISKIVGEYKAVSGAARTMIEIRGKVINAEKVAVDLDIEQMQKGPNGEYVTEGGMTGRDPCYVIKEILKLDIKDMGSINLFDLLMKNRESYDEAKGKNAVQKLEHTVSNLNAATQGIVTVFNGVRKPTIGAKVENYTTTTHYTVELLEKIFEEREISINDTISEIITGSEVNKNRKIEEINLARKGPVLTITG